MRIYERTEPRTKCWAWGEVREGIIWEYYRSGLLPGADVLYDWLSMEERGELRPAELADAVDRATKGEQ